MLICIASLAQRKDISNFLNENEILLAVIFKNAVQSSKLPCSLQNYCACLQNFRVLQNCREVIKIVMHIFKIADQVSLSNPKKKTFHIIFIINIADFAF